MESTMKAIVHFIGFRGDEYHSAVRIWGKPDFIHMKWDRRAQIEIVDGDIAIFAVGDEHEPVPFYNGLDTLPQDPKNGV
jgi:hypothetical protein